MNNLLPVSIFNLKALIPDLVKYLGRRPAFLLIYRVRITNVTPARGPGSVQSVNP
jgi:hypothetical protein